MDFVTALHEAFEKYNFHYRGQINYFLINKFQRLAYPNKRSRDLFICIHSDLNGASFGDWNYDPSDWINWRWQTPQERTEQERKELQQKIFLDNRRQELLRIHGIWHAQVIWGQLYNHWQAVPSPDHPYIRKKRIRPLYARQLKECIVLPVRNIQGDIQSLQYIWPDGKKRFKPNTTPKNGMLVLGERPTPILRIVEGWATGCTVYEAVGEAVVVTFGKDNLLSVARQLKQAFPSSMIHICGDSDPGGAKAAQQAALQTNGIAILPRVNNGNDFNDLLCEAGIEAVEQQLLEID